MNRSPKNDSNHVLIDIDLSSNNLHRSNGPQNSRVIWTKLFADCSLPPLPSHPLVTGCPAEIQFVLNNKTTTRAVNIAFNVNIQTSYLHKWQKHYL